MAAGRLLPRRPEVIPAGSMGWCWIDADDGIPEQTNILRGEEPAQDTHTQEGGKP